MTSAAAPARPGGHAGPQQLEHGQIVKILSGLMLGMFLAALDQTIVASAIRTIGDDLQGLSVQAWVTTAYLVTATITTPLYGKLSDIYGRKPFFLTAITVFILGSALCSFATSMYMLAAFRAVQGLGAGGLFSLALAIIGDIVPARERARYQGYFLAVFGTSSVLGPVIGGFFAGADNILGVTGWRWVFLVNVPVGLVALVVVARVLNIAHQPRDHRIDWQGALALTVSLVPLLTVAEQGRGWGWGSTRSITCYAIGVLGLLGFLWAESHAREDALIPLRMFRNRTFSLTSIVSLIMGMGMFGGIAVLPLYLQIVRGASPTESGLLLLPLTGGIMLGSVVSGQLISRTGRYKVFPILGTVLMSAGMFLLHLVGADTPFWHTSVYMAVFGLGLGNVMQPITLAVQNAMPPQDIGVATSSATFFRQMGGTLGTAVFLSVLFSSVGDRIADAFRTAVSTPAFQAAVNDPAVAADPANAPVVQALRSGGQVGGATLDDTSFLQRVNAVLAQPFKVGFSDSMDLVFLLAALVILVALAVLLFLPELPLRSQAAMVAAAKPSSPLGEQPGMDPAAAAGQSPAQQPQEQLQEQLQEQPQEQPPHRSGLPRLEPFETAPAVATNGGGDGWSPRAAPALSNAAVLSGVVRGGGGSPIAGAMLTVTDAAGRQVVRGRSDTDGSFRLALPTGGTYLLICAALDHQPVASMVAVADGELRRDLSLVAASRVEGRVVRTDGRPVAEATLTLTDLRGDVVATAITGPTGEYALTDLYPGLYTLTTAAAGSRPDAQSLDLADAGTYSCDVVLVGSGALSGTIRAASSGRPIAEATVTLVDAAGVVVATTATGDDGTYSFDDLRPGPYTLTASGYAPVAARVDLGLEPQQGRDVALGRGPVGAVDGTAVNGTAVDGTAVDGTAVDGTAVDGSGAAGTYGTGDARRPSAAGATVLTRG